LAGFVALRLCNDIVNDSWCIARHYSHFDYLLRLYIPDCKVPNCKVPNFLVTVLGITLLILIFQQHFFLPRVQTAISQVKNYVTISQAENAKKTASVYRTSVGVRLVEWDFSRLVFKESPIWGLGRKGAERAKERYVREGISPPALLMFKKGHVHNQYLQELVMRGLIGVFALIALLFVPLKQGMRRAKENDWTGYAIISLSIAFATFCLTETSLKHPYKIYVYLLFMAFLYLLPRQTTSDRS
jgi:O-antigen ligase